MAVKNRPLTVKEMQANKKAIRDADNNKIRIRNKTTLQLVPIQIYGRDSKKAVHQISIQIAPGSHVDLPAYRIIPEQIATLKKRGFITTTKIGSSGKNISDANYHKFLNTISAKEKASPVATGKNVISKGSKKDSKSTNKNSKSTKSDS